MLHLAAGNKNKKKNIRIESTGGKTKEATRTTFFRDPQPAASTSFAPPPPPASVPSTPNGKKEKKQYLPYPSARSDLPPNVVVTKVNVLAKTWVAGVGEVIKGTGDEWVARAEEDQKTVVEREDATVVVEEVREGRSEEAGWEGWPSREAVEAKWEDLRGIQKEEGKDGDRVAVKVRSPAPTIGHS